MRLRDKVAIVTGGSGGLGGGICRAFAAEGADCLVAYHRDEAGAEATAQAVRDAGRRAEVMQADVTQEDAVLAMVRRTLEVFGRLDIAVANSGTGVRRSFIETTSAQFDRVVAVNLRGTYLTLRHAAEPMTKSGGGKLITISSVHGLAGSHLFSLYASTKAGIIGLTRGAAFDLADHNIQANCIAPGAVPVPGEGRMDPDGRLAQAWYKAMPANRMGRIAEIGAGAVYLASADSDWITGQVLAIDGGATAGMAVPNLNDFREEYEVMND